MPTTAEYEARIKKLKWPGLTNLWEAIQARDTPGWDAGKAFEYLILRAFDLDRAEVRWPYSVSLFGEEIEQIDGSVRAGGLYGLVECKDEMEDVASVPIAKMRNQLLRRPAGTIGLVFSSRRFTEAAATVAYFTLPQAVLLWNCDEVAWVLEKKAIGIYWEKKFRMCVDSGLPDFDITTGG